MTKRFCRRIGVWRAALVASATTIGVLACMAGTASAILIKLPRGGYAGYAPLIKTSAPDSPRIFDTHFSNLDYSGGPVMASNTNYVVVWQPAGYSGVPFQSGSGGQLGYISGVGRYFQDLAADSGKATNSDAVSTQYNDVNGHTAAYRSVYGGTYTDPDPLPANGCPANPGDICLTDAQLQTELNNFLSANHLPADLSHEYFLLTPPSVASCIDAAGSACSGNADLNLAYCAYHSESTHGYVYANIPDEAGLPGCDPFVTSCPPGVSCAYDNGPADGMLTGISHEHNESTTDPEPNSAWTDLQVCYSGSPQTCGGEIGDKCADDEFADPNLNLQADGLGNATPYNETINGHHYLLQMEWSNQGKGCRDRFTGNGSSATAKFSASANSPTTLTFSAAGSTATGGVAEYVWQFNDDPMTLQANTVETTSPTISHTFPLSGYFYTVALTVMGPDGTSIGTAKNVAVGAENPTARFVAPSGLQKASLGFNGSASSDPTPGGYITKYSWTFGDGSTATGARVSHAYARPGSYTATLTVTTNYGLTSRVSHTVKVAASCVVPKLIGKTLTQAKTAVGAAGCTMGRVPAAPPKPTRSAGAGKHWALRVGWQSPAAGRIVPKWTTVHVTLAWRAVNN